MRVTRPRSSPPRHRRPTLTPTLQFILDTVPRLPNMIVIEDIAEAIKTHPQLKYTCATDPGSLHKRLCLLVNRERIVRIDRGLYAKPRDRQDVLKNWHPSKFKQMPGPTLSQQLKRANAKLRAELLHPHPLEYDPLS